MGLDRRRGWGRTATGSEDGRDCAWGESLRLGLHKSNQRAISSGRTADYRADRRLTRAGKQERTWCFWLDYPIWKSGECGETKPALGLNQRTGIPKTGGWIWRLPLGRKRRGQGYFETWFERSMKKSAIQAIDNGFFKGNGGEGGWEVAVWAEGLAPGGRRAGLEKQISAGMTDKKQAGQSHAGEMRSIFRAFSPANSIGIRNPGRCPGRG
jgi:hypothetical protein